MSLRIFAVMGATGHIGHVVVEDLVKRGYTVRAIGHSEEKVHKLRQEGVETYCVDFQDADALSEAFKGCYAVFTMLPPINTDVNQDWVSEAICKAIKASQVKRVVNLSSIGADLEEGTGPIKWLHRHEERLNSLEGLDVLIHLRPDYFMENLEMYLPMIKNEGLIRSPIDQNLPIPMIATRDIGWKAADFLDCTAPLGHMVFEFIGPKNVTMNEVTDMFSYVFDHPGLWYKEISMDEAKDEMLASGWKPEVVDQMIEMYEAFNEGLIVPTEEASGTHRGITSLEEYVHMLAHRLMALVRQ